MNRKQLTEAIARLESKLYCNPDEHTWVAVVGGRGFNPDFDSTVCIRCECYSSVRKPKHEARKPHPATMAGR